MFSFLWHRSIRMKRYETIHFLYTQQPLKLNWSLAFIICRSPSRWLKQKPAVVPQTCKLVSRGSLQRPWERLLNLFHGRVRISFTDDSSQAISIPEAPALIDVNGIPDKTTAVESGASYLTGKPLLVLNRESNDQDVNKWFLYYPLSKESNMQMPWPYFSLFPGYWRKCSRALSSRARKYERNTKNRMLSFMKKLHSVIHPSPVELT